jgi:hypothetical protein
VQGLAVNELGYRRLQFLFEGCMDSKKHEGKHFGPLLVCVAHDGGFQRSVEAFDQSVGGGMTSNRPRKVNTAKLGEGVEEL